MKDRRHSAFLRLAYNRRRSEGAGLCIHPTAAAQLALLQRGLALFLFPLQHPKHVAVAADVELFAQLVDVLALGVGEHIDLGQQVRICPFSRRRHPVLIQRLASLAAYAGNVHGSRTGHEHAILLGRSSGFIRCLTGTCILAIVKADGCLGLGRAVVAFSERHTNGSCVSHLRR